jgi:hypothetical protein
MLYILADGKKLISHVILKRKDVLKEKNYSHCNYIQML